MNTYFETESPNSKTVLCERIKDGRIPWIAPVLMVLARPVFALLGQGITVLLFAAQGDPSPLQSSAPWWTVYGTGIDIACLVLLLILVKREGIRLSDLVSFKKKKLLIDIPLGIGFCAIAFPAAVLLGSIIASVLVYGGLQPRLPDGAFIRHLPLWGVIYSRAVWWIIWSFTEEITFQGYSLPRLQCIFGRTWMAVGWVSFGWALQHSFLPFINISHAVWLFVAFFPLTMAMQLLYLRIRRLAPLIVAHWLMDLGSVLLLVTT